MQKINLRDFYPNHYTVDTYIDVTDDIAAYLRESEKAEAAYQRRKYYHRAHYSLDRGDGIECDAVFLSVSPWEIYERKLTSQELHAAMMALPEKQSKRLISHFFFNMTMTEIAEVEGVSIKAVSESIEKALSSLKKFFQKI